MRRRFVRSMLLNASQGSVKLWRAGLIGFSPLAVMAAMRSERILAKLLGLIPAVTGLIAFSLFRSCPRSRAIRPGSSPTKAQKRQMAERRSRILTGERSGDISTASSTAARVGPAEDSAGAEECL